MIPGIVAGAPVEAPQYLDELATSPQAVFSLRKLISTATNSIRVRRSSDNAQQDIGFSGDDLDTVALASFVGANSAYVVTLYDQTGNGHNATQATAASQPRIVNAGTFDGHLVFDGSNDALGISSLTQGTAYCGFYGRLRQQNSASFRSVFESGTNWQSPGGGLVLTTVNNNAALAMGSTNAAGGTGSARQNNFTAASMAAIETVAALYNRTLTGLSELALYRNGSAITAASGGLTVEQTGTFSSLATNIGGRTGAYSDMWMETAVFYNADTAAIRAAIEAIITP